MAPDFHNGGETARGERERQRDRERDSERETARERDNERERERRTKERERARHYMKFRWDNVLRAHSKLCRACLKDTVGTTMLFQIFECPPRPSRPLLHHVCNHPLKAL